MKLPLQSLLKVTLPKKIHAYGLSFFLGISLFLCLLTVFASPTRSTKARAALVQNAEAVVQEVVLSALPVMDGPEPMILHWTNYEVSGGGAGFQQFTAAVAKGNDEVWFAGFVAASGSGNVRIARYIYSADSWTYFTIEPSVSSVYEMAFDESGNLWLATDGGALKGIPGQSSFSWIAYDETHEDWPISNDDVRTVAIDGSTIWFGTYGGGAISYTPGATPNEWVTFSHTGSSNNELCNNNVHRIVLQDTEDIWFGTGDGLCKLDALGQWTTEVELDNAIVRDIAIDGEGNVWAVQSQGADHGLSVLTATGWVHYSETNGELTDDQTAFSIAIDSAQRKWIGFNGYGVDVFSADNQERVNITDGTIGGDVVNDIVEAPNGDIWLAISSSSGEWDASRAVTGISGFTANSSSPTLYGTTTTFTTTLIHGSGVDYTWSFGDGTLPVSGANVTHTYQAPGLYTAIVTASNSISQVATSMLVDVDELITGLVVGSSSPTIPGDETIFTATVTTGHNVNFAWSYGNGDYGAGSPDIHLYPELGLYTVVVTASNAFNSVTATTNALVVDTPIADLAALHSGPSTVNNAVVFTATLTSGSNVTYTWDFGDNSGSIGTPVTHTYQAIGNYTATLTATNSISQVATAVEITIYSAEVNPSFSTITVLGDAVATADGQGGVQVRIAARDQFDNPIGNAPVALSANGPLQFGAINHTDAQGWTTATITSNEIGIFVVTATVASVPLQVPVTVTFRGPDLVVTQSQPLPPQPFAGLPVTYTIHVTNNGVLTASEVVITDVLPDGFTFKAQSNAGNLTFIQNGSTLAWEATELAVGESLTLTVVTTPTASLADGIRVTNIVTASTSTTELSTGDNTSQLLHTVRQPTSLLYLSPGQLTLNVPYNQTSIITFTVKNIGPIAMTDAILVPPSVMPWLEVTPTELPDLAFGERAVITLTIPSTSNIPSGTYRDFIAVTNGANDEQRIYLTTTILPETRPLQISIANDQGQIVAGAYVGLIMPDGLVDVTPVFSRTINIVAEGATNTSGDFIMEDLPLGVYTYTLYAPNHELATGVITVTGGSGIQTAAYTLTALPALTVSPLSPVLVTSPDVMGNTELLITNSGAAPLAGISVNTPSNYPWVYLGTSVPITVTLQPGESLSLGLYARPPVNQPVGAYNTYLTVSGGGQQQQVALTVHVTTQSSRDLDVTITNSNSQPLAGAAVTLIQQTTTVIVTEGVTTTIHQHFSSESDGSGLITFSELPLGNYDYLVTKPGYKPVRGTFQVLPENSTAQNSEHLSKPNRQGTGAQTWTIPLTALPFDYSWTVTPLQMGYEIQLLINQIQEPEEGIALLVPSRRWRFSPCVSTSLTDEISLYNLSNTTIHITDVIVNVPGVATTVSSFPSEVPPGGSGSIIIEATGSATMGQGTITVVGSYETLSETPVSFTVNPSSLTTQDLFAGQSFTQDYSLQPVLGESGTTYDVSLRQPSLLSWISVSGPATVSSDTPATLALNATTPGWLSPGTFTDVVQITLTDEEDNSRNGLLHLEVTKSPDGIVQLHTNFTLEDPETVEAPLTGTGTVNPIRKHASCDGGSGNENDSGSDDGWTFQPLPGGGLQGTAQGGNGDGSGTPPFNNLFGTGIQVTGDTSQEVSLELTQQLLLEGESFQASLRLTNRLSDQSITNVSVELIVRDGSGNNVTSQFYIDPDAEVNLGNLPAYAGRTTHWVLGPDNLNVTQSSGQVFFVEAKINYTLNSEARSFTTLPRSITVFPAPRLVIQYELPGGSDPELVCKTFELRATITNTGAGPARNVRLTSGQLALLNYQGDAQGFLVRSVLLDGNPVANSAVDVVIGTIPPGESRTVQWIIEGNAYGRFSAFTSDYRVLNYQGGSLPPPLLSEIHTTFNPNFEYGCTNVSDPNVGAPDLTVAILDAPNQVAISQTVQVEAQVMNLGGEINDTVTVRFEYYYLSMNFSPGDTENGVIVATWVLLEAHEHEVVLDLAHGETYILSDTFTVPLFANFQIRVVVDPAEPVQ